MKEKILNIISIVYLFIMIGLFILQFFNIYLINSWNNWAIYLIIVCGGGYCYKTFLEKKNKKNLIIHIFLIIISLFLKDNLILVLLPALSGCIYAISRGCHRNYRIILIILLLFCILFYLYYAPFRTITVETKNPNNENYSIISKISERIWAYKFQHCLVESYHVFYRSWFLTDKAIVECKWIDDKTFVLQEIFDEYVLSIEEVKE